MRVLMEGDYELRDMLPDREDDDEESSDPSLPSFICDWLGEWRKDQTIVVKSKQFFYNLLTRIMAMTAFAVLDKFHARGDRLSVDDARIPGMRVLYGGKSNMMATLTVSCWITKHSFICVVMERTK